MSTQIKHSFDRASIIKMLKGAGIAGGGVAGIYILEWLLTVDFGPYTPIAVGVLSILINNLKEWLKGE